MDLEDLHYNFCVKHNRDHIHFAWPGKEYPTILSLEDLDKHDALMKDGIERIATSMINDHNILWSMLPKDIPRYGLPDYIALGNIKYGALALFKLGYKPDINNSEHCQDPCYVHIFHPNKVNPTAYEDYKGHDFCKLWSELVTLINK